MAWLRLRDKVLINIDTLASLELRSSAGMAHCGPHTREKLEQLVNFCFTTSDGKEFLRYFVPIAKAETILTDLQSLFTSSREVIILDSVFTAHGVRPQDTY